MSEKIAWVVGRVAVVATIALVAVACGAADTGADEAQPGVPIVLPNGVTADGHASVDKEVLWDMTYESFAQLLQQADLAVVGTIVAVGVGEETPDSIYQRVLTVDVKETLYGSAPSQITVVDGSEWLADGRGSESNDHQWLDVGDTAYFVVAEQDHGHFGADHPFGVLQVQNGAWVMSPNLEFWFEGTEIPDSPEALRALIAASAAEIEAGTVPAWVDPQVYARAVENVVGETIDLVSAEATDGSMWVLRGAESEAGFCYSFDRVENATKPAQCYGTEEIEAVLSSDGVLQGRIGGEFSLAVTHRGASLSQAEDAEGAEVLTVAEASLVAAGFPYGLHLIHLDPPG